MIHKLRLDRYDERLRVRLVGCGGNDSQMLTGLARLHKALVALGQRGLYVIANDPDTVSPANIGRQLFSPGDVGRNKAVVLVHRLNSFFGLDWNAEPFAFKFTDKTADILVSCVDSRKSRASIDDALTRRGMFNNNRPGPEYWLDLGNRAADGQMVLGQPAQNKRWAADKTRLPTVAELFPEIVDTHHKEDTAPSCSLAEALQKQELFVNQAVVTQALALLWQVLRHGETDWHGAFVNCKSGRVIPLPVDPAAWQRLREGQQQKKGKW